MANKAAAAVYRGYMPIGLPQHRPPNRIKPWWKVQGKPTITIYPKPEVEEWAEEAEYPPLNDGSKVGIKKKVRLDWYESIKKIPTAEQKSLEITKHNRHFAVDMYNYLDSINSLPMAQYLTNTNISQNGLPEKYKESIIDEESLILARKAVLDGIKLHCFDSYRNDNMIVPQRLLQRGIKKPKEYQTSKMIQDIVSSLKKIFVNDSQFLINAQLDLDPIIKSWFWHSGFFQPNNKKFYNSRKDEDGHINQMVQMRFQPALNIRYDSLLEPIVSFDDPLAKDLDAIPKYDYNLKSFGTYYRWKHPAMMAGFWYESEPKFDCPHTTFLTTNFLDSKIVNAESEDEVNNFLDSQAIMTAFGWLNAIASYHGFTPYQELTYPLTCQVITTNGMDWVFHVYQLNTHTFHRDFGKKCSVNNVCWSSGVMQLYKSEVDGHFVQVNDDVLKYLIKFITNEPNMDIAGVGLRPYLSQDTRDDDTKSEDRMKLQTYYENRFQAYEHSMRRVPLWEHLFKRSKEGRNLGLMARPPNSRPATPLHKFFD